MCFKISMFLLNSDNLMILQELQQLKKIIILMGTLQSKNKTPITQTEQLQKIIEESNRSQIHLDYSNNKIESISWLTSAYSTKNMISLNLQNCNIGLKGCRQLSKIQWIHLRNLSMKQNKIGTEQCLHLIKADWKILKSLNLNNNLLTDQSCLNIIKAQWKLLEYLDIQNNKITKIGIQILLLWPVTDILRKRLINNRIYRKIRLYYNGVYYYN